MQDKAIFHSAQLSSDVCGTVAREKSRVRPLLCLSLMPLLIHVKMKTRVKCQQVEYLYSILACLLAYFLLIFGQFKQKHPQPH